MSQSFRSSLVWRFKRNIWQIILAASLVASLFFASFTVQCALAAIFILRISLDLWNFLSFKSYSLENDQTKKTKNWQEILQEFKLKKGKLAFYGVQRTTVAFMIESLIESGNIIQSNNNLCGPIAFLTFLLNHNPSLFVKTACEYFENGCTYAPFYLQSSFWDRYYQPLQFLSNLFFTPLEEKLASAFKNTHNLTGYNQGCYFESFKGLTEPKLLTLWLSQAGYNYTSNVTVQNYNQDGEMPAITRGLVGGLYDVTNKTKSFNCNSDTQHCYLNLSLARGNSPLEYVFNVGSAHWTYDDKMNNKANTIQIHLPANNAQLKRELPLKKINESRPTAFCLNDIMKGHRRI